MDLAAQENLPLSYRVYKWSSFSPKYLPENILKNEPTEPASRWSSASNTPPQYLLLKLAQPAIVRSIMFGKFEKSHVCNIKKFKVLGGDEENSLVELLRGGLKNDHNPETFHLNHKHNGHPFPCRYIKIIPLLSWGSSFNFSIWYVKLWGVDSSEVVQPCLKWHYEQREQEAIRLCLKHFRQNNYTNAFNELQNKTKINLEHPLLAELHEELVKEGDFNECEKIIERAASDDLFGHFINHQKYKTQWNNISLKDCNQPDGVPGMRGGHQMCMDHINNHVYLLGGWNGTKDLADFWRFEVETSTWVCLSLATDEVGGPSARSCHKICIDCENGKLYTLGRYLDSSKRTRSAVRNDFHVYHINENRWELLCKDTSEQDGPRLIFDHQMCIDQKSQMIYVFGGRILTSNHCVQTNLIRPLPEFSGLYRYHIHSNTWKLLREDSGNAGPQDIRSRIGHSMLLDTQKHVLYVFGGQRSKEYINDFFVYDIEQDSVTILHDGTKKEENAHEQGLPPAGFTQRATINPELREIYMLSGLSKDKEKREDNMYNSFWIYCIEKDSWTCIYKNGATSDTDSTITEPCPRYAHQLVYDHIRQVHYMFGGNPGSKTETKLRLSDFWCLKLLRPSRSNLLKKCCYLIRKQKFCEDALKDPVRALSYLQNDVSEVVSHDDPSEEREFQLLASSLFGAISDSDSDDDSAKLSSSLKSLPQNFPPAKLKKSYRHLKYATTDLSDVHIQRTKVFDKLTSFFPSEMTQPNGNIVDMMKF